MDRFRVRECPPCRFDLREAGHAGRCPECGTEYGADAYVVTGVDVYGLSLWRRWMALCLAVVVAVGGAMIVTPTFAIVLLVVLVAAVAYRAHRRGSRCSLLLTPHGVTQHWDRDARPLSWHRVSRAWIEPARFDEAYDALRVLDDDGEQGARLWHLRIAEERSAGQLLLALIRPTPLVSMAFRADVGDVTALEQIVQQCAGRPEVRPT